MHLGQAHPTPLLRTWGRHRDKVSVAAALSVTAQRRRVGLYFCTAAKHYFNVERIAVFLGEEMLLHLRGAIIVP